MKPKISFKSREGRYYATLMVKTDGKSTEKYVGIYDTREEASEALEKVMSGVPIEEVRKGRKERKLDKRNVAGIKGVTFVEKLGKWRAFIAGEHLGYFPTKEEAGEAVAVFEKTGEKPEGRTPLNMSYSEDKKVWRAYVGKERLGTFTNKADAQKAIEIFETTGKKPFLKRKGMSRTPLYDIEVNGEMKKAKHCRICGELKPLDNFRELRVKGKIYHNYKCNECGRKTLKEQYQEAQPK